MELKLIDGDYVSDGNGGQVRLDEKEALLQRVLFRLSARRGAFFPVPELGSQLWKLGRESGAKRLSAARQYVTEALADEDVIVSDIRLSDAGGGRMRLEVDLLSGEDALQAVLTL